MAEPLPPRLRAGYYLDNFEIVLRAVEARHGDLLRETERRFLADWRCLDLGARRLFVRLATRRGPWFRLDRLDYAEIELPAAVAALQAAGFATLSGEADAEAHLAELDRAELAAWLRARGLAASAAAPRVDLLAAGTVECRAPGAAASLLGRVRLLRLEHRPVLRVLRLLYFGNLGQDWTEFVLRDLGVLRFEPVAIAPTDRAFSSREELDRHLALQDLREETERALERADLAHAATLAERIAAERWSGRERRRADRVLLRVARELERRGEQSRALALYEAAERPPARERRVRILIARGGLAEAARLAAAMAREPRDESERVFAERHGARLAARRAGRPARPRSDPSLNERDIAASGPRESAEAAALAALAQEGYRGVFAENWLWRALFGLAFWDVIFAPVPGAFVHPFQIAPRDLYDGFRDARAMAVAARLEELRAQPRLDALLAVWERKFGIANALVPFAAQREPALRLAVQCMRGPQLAAVCDRLSRDLRRYGTGLPDLLLTHPTREPLLLAEVKAPGDTLRPEQRGWLRYLAEHGVPATVLRLRWKSP